MSILEDPLEEYKGLSIFPQTLASLPTPPQPFDPDDLLSVHSFFISLPVRNTDKLMQQAKSILEGGSEVPKDAAFKSEIETVVDKVAGGKRERRPGLDRKRPRFSLLPNVSQSSVNLEPTLDMDKLTDPEEFFKAFERLQNAKKEIDKQTGRVSISANQYSTTFVPRPRRPGIPGRSRKVQYKHLYPTMSSQESVEEGFLSPSGHTLEKEAPNVDIAPQGESESTEIASQHTQPDNEATEEMELAGSMAKTEGKINKLLEELLSQDCEELHRDGAVTLLKERLQMKPVVIEKLNLPEMQNIRTVDLESSGKSLKKPRNVLSDIHNLIKFTRNKTPMKQEALESSASSFGSPTPPRSPFGSISLLKKWILQSNPIHDPFSAADMDQSVPPNASSIEDISVDVQTSVSGNLKSLGIEEDNDVGDRSSPKVAVGDSNSASDKSDGDNLIDLDSSVKNGHFESCAVLEESNVVMDDQIMNENLSFPDIDADVGTKEQNEWENMVDDMIQEAIASVQPELNMDDVAVENLNKIPSLSENPSATAVEDHASAATSEKPNVVDDMVQEAIAPVQPENNMDDVAAENLNEIPSLSENPSAAAVEDHVSAATSEQVHVTASELPNVQNQEPPEVSMDEQTKAKSRPPRKHKEKVASRRQSLAASGTSWETGMRRSTRIRSRPLEYWKGEKFLYGRIHSSLPTVIGIKYESPGKGNEQAAIKVKSFVSEQYKDLIKLAAL